MWYWVFDLNLPLLLLLNGSSVWVWVMCWIANPGHSVWAIRHIFTNKSNQKPLWVSTTLQGFKQLWSSLWEPQRRHERKFYFIFFCSVLFVGFVFFFVFCLFLFVTRNFFFKVSNTAESFGTNSNALQSTAWGQIQASMGKLQSWQGFDLDVLVSYCSFIFALHKLHGHIMFNYLQRNTCYILHSANFV